MRIGLDARYVYPSHVHGIGRYSLELVRHLIPLAAERGHQLVVFRRADLGSALFPGSGVQEVPLAQAPVSLFTVTRLGEIARRASVDVYHALFPMLPLRPAPRTVVTAHDLQALRVPGFHGRRSPGLALASKLFYRWAYRRAFGGADRIIAGSRWTRDDVASCFALPEARFRVVHEGLGAEFFVAGGRPEAERARLEALGLDPSQPLLLHVGNTRPQKNVEGLLRTYQELRRVAPSDGVPVLVIAGVRDRFFAGVRDLTDRLGLRSHVRFVTGVDDDTLRALYRAARLYITLARFEGFGFTPLEAMAAGCPVAAAAEGALPEMLGSCYLPLDADSPSGAACAILALISDRLRLQDLAARGRDRAQAFRWEDTARATLNVYEELARPS